MILDVVRQVAPLHLVKRRVVAIRIGRAAELFGDLAREPAVDRMSFLKPTADELFAEYGTIVAVRIPVPKLIPVEPAKKRDSIRARNGEDGPEFSSQ